MDLSSITDSEGNTMKFRQYQGRKFHPNIEENVSHRIQSISSLKTRPDDVMLCTYPKSGTHWVFNIIHMLRSHNLQYVGSPDVLEYIDLDKMNLKDSPRTYHTHMTFPLIPEEAKQGKIKVIHVLRNPKDVLCSFYNYQNRMNNKLFQGTFDGFVNFFLSDEFPHCGGTWFTYMKEWTEAKMANKHLNILTLYYEDLVRDLFSNVVNLAKFLEVEHDVVFLRQVVEAVSFDNLKSKHATDSGIKDTWMDWIKDGRLPIYHKGKVGSWKEAFTVAQNEKFDAVYKEKMSAMNIDPAFIFK
ncbi:sulfotransferase 1C2-like [Ylistrum balloti]|uniref:sulfotransferase 1C2-like n=1 Tax=Ylistrum balloti TaxID=509963 RepID=UPI002905DDA5|nr:sulfotransferase 1C2-like [Ylistrum balloti]